MEARSLPLAVLILLLTSVGWRCNEVIVSGHLALPLVRRTAKDQFIFAGLQSARGYHQGDEPPPVGLLRGQSSLSPYLSAAGGVKFDAIAAMVGRRIKFELHLHHPSTRWNTQSSRLSGVAFDSTGQSQFDKIPLGDRRRR